MTNQTKNSKTTKIREQLQHSHWCSDGIVGQERLQITRWGRLDWDGLLGGRLTGGLGGQTFMTKNCPSRREFMFPK